jgi:hypothetical protein
MAQKINRLRQADLKRTKPGLYCDGAGLYLRVSIGLGEAINRSWVYRYALDEVITKVGKDGVERRRQRESQIGLGPIHLVSLEDARAAARELDRKRRSGEDRDPATTRREAKLARRTQKAEEQAAKRAEASKTTLTFDRAMDGYIDSVKSQRTSDKHQGDYKTSLTKFACPILGAMPVETIAITDVLAVLTPLWQRIPETASRVRGRIQSVLDYGYSVLHENDDQAVEHLVSRNPARLSSHLKRRLGAHDAVSPVHSSRRELAAADRGRRDRP